MDYDNWPWKLACATLKKVGAGLQPIDGRIGESKKLFSNLHTHKRYMASHLHWSWPNSEIVQHIKSNRITNVIKLWLVDWVTEMGTQRHSMKVDTEKSFYTAKFSYERENFYFQKCWTFWFEWRLLLLCITIWPGAACGIIMINSPPIPPTDSLHPCTTTYNEL